MDSERRQKTIKLLLFLFYFFVSFSFPVFLVRAEFDIDFGVDADLDAVCASWCANSDRETGTPLTQSPRQNINSSLTAGARRLLASVVLSLTELVGIRDRTLGVNYSSNGADGDWPDSETDSDPLWLLCSSRCGRSECNYRNEIPLSKVIGGLYSVGEITDITEGGLQSWSYFFDHRDPSGDRSTLIDLMQESQECNPKRSSISPNQQQKDLDIIKSFTDDGFPLPFAIESADAGASHAIIALKVIISSSGSYQNNSLQEKIYYIRFLDPNGPRIGSLSCSSYQDIKTGEKFSPGCLYYVGSWPVFVGIDSSPYLDLAKSMRDSWRRACGLSSSKSAAHPGICGRHPITDWLVNNYPDIPNASFMTSAGTETGFCGGWVDFAIRVAYLGNFVGECRGLVKASPPVESQNTSVAASGLIRFTDRHPWWIWFLVAAILLVVVSRITIKPSAKDISESPTPPNDSEGNS